MIAINQNERFLGNEVKKGELSVELINETYFHFCNYLKVGKKKRRKEELVPWSVKFINTGQKSVVEDILEVRYSDKFIEKYGLKVRPTDPPIFRFYVSKYDSNSYHKLKNPVTREEINTISDSDTEKSLKDDTKITLYDHWRLLIENDKAIFAKKPKGIFIGNSMINHLFGIVNDKTESEEIKAFRFNEYTDIAQTRKKIVTAAAALTGVIIATKLSKNVVKKVEHHLEREGILLGARQYLIKNEDIPPGVINIPNENEHFMFAEEILEKALTLYKDWAWKKNLPPAFFRKSKSYFDLMERESLRQIFDDTTFDFNSFMRQLITERNQSINHEKLTEKYIRLHIEFSNRLQSQLESHVYKNQTFGSMPIDFTESSIQGPMWLVSKNPGSPIINKVCKAVDITNENIAQSISEGNAVDSESRSTKVLNSLRQEIDDIWSWVDDYVSKTKKPMTLDVFLAGLLYRNKGDITGSLWDAALLTKLASRNKPESFAFYTSKPDDLAKKSTDLYLERLQDQFAPRLSANWVNEHNRNDDLFAYDIEYHHTSGKNYKHVDRYCASGNIYHGIGIMALCTVTSPELVQAMILKKHFGYDFSARLIGPDDYGMEKNVADLLVAYDIPNVRKILDKYEVV